MLMLSLIQLFVVIVILVKEFLLLIDFFYIETFPLTNLLNRQKDEWVCVCVRAYSILIDFRKLFESFSILEKIIAYMWV